MIDREKVIKGLYAHGYRDCKSCPYWGTGNNGMSACRQLAREAYALLKEQEAVKPIYNDEKYGDHLPHCGNCEKVIPSHALYGKANFCHYCGKAVKWNDNPKDARIA